MASRTSVRARCAASSTRADDASVYAIAASRARVVSSQRFRIAGADARTRCAAPSTASQATVCPAARQTWGPRAAQSRHASVPQRPQK